jgi:hypothetical protein
MLILHTSIQFFGSDILGSVSDVTKDSILWASGFEIWAAQLAIQTNGNTRQTTRRHSP